MFGNKSSKSNQRSTSRSVTPQSSMVEPEFEPEFEPEVELAADQLPPADYDSGIVNIGSSIHIKGELTGNEDLTIDGTVEGSIQLREHYLTIGVNGHITGEVSASSAVIFGHVVGDIHAVDLIEIGAGGIVEGDLIAPRVALADGARFKGRIDMLSGMTAPQTEPMAAWGDLAEASTSGGIPDGFVAAVPDENPTAQDSEAKTTAKTKGKGKKAEKKSSMESDGEAALSEIFDGFDPANP